MNLFGEIDIINTLKEIITNIEENQERKNVIFAYYLETKKKPKQCDCGKGLERLHCKKCNGTGYILVEENESEEDR